MASLNAVTHMWTSTLDDLGGKDSGGRRGRGTVEDEVLDDNHEAAGLRSPTLVSTYRVTDSDAAVEVVQFESSSSRCYIGDPDVVAELGHSGPAFASRILGDEPGAHRIGEGQSNGSAVRIAGEAIPSWWLRKLGFEASISSTFPRCLFVSRHTHEAGRRSLSRGVHDP